MRIRRRVRRDSTVSRDGEDYELAAGHLAGRIVNVCRTLAAPQAPPWVELEGQRLMLQPVEPVRNGRRERPYRRPHLDETAPRHTAFEPARSMLHKAAGRRPAHRREEEGER